VTMKRVKESDRNRLEGSIRRAYLGGWKSLDWIVGVIESSMFKGKDLKAILDEVEQNSTLDNAKKEGMKQLRTELKNKGFL